ncbi:MAG: hypothetical protein JSS68_10670 [Actinobacteria bacterium]|nr:hypothetical protein [Actinomycetota bacterium]
MKEKPPISSENKSHCFLCDPEPEYTWAESAYFRAVLGVGPIGEGFTLIAARDHLPSMLDLGDAESADLVAFTERVRGHLSEVYGPTVVAEHGRVAPCVAPSVRRHEPHCLHAHRLVFPGLVRMDLAELAPGLRRERYPDFWTVREHGADVRQYLYVEDRDGCQLGRVSGPLPRQFLRGFAALLRGEPELADWRSTPGFQQIHAAQAALGLTAVA